MDIICCTLRGNLELVNRGAVQSGQFAGRNRIRGRTGSGRYNVVQVNSSYSKYMLTYELYSSRRSENAKTLTAPRHQGIISRHCDSIVCFDGVEPRLNFGASLVPMSV